MSCAVLFLLYAFKKTYREHIRNISNLSKRRYMKIEKLERELLESSRNYDVQEKSYQLKMQLWGEQTQQLNDNLAYPRRSLEVLAQIRLNPSKTVINIENQTEILNSCISIAELYSFSNQSKTNLSIEEIVEMVQDIFSNIVHRKKIKTSFEHDNIPEILGNPLGIKFIFLNIIGKAIYRVPKKGFIQISGIKVKDVYKITIRDNGFSLNHKQEHSLNTSYPFFLDKKAVKQLASKNHLSLKESKQNDLNETIIELHSTKNKKGTGNNVVPLFT